MELKVNFSKDTQDMKVIGPNNGDFEIKTLDEWIALAVGDENLTDDQHEIA